MRRAWEFVHYTANISSRLIIARIASRLQDRTGETPGSAAPFR